MKKNYRLRDLLLDSDIPLKKTSSTSVTPIYTQFTYVKYMDIPVKLV